MHFFEFLECSYPSLPNLLDMRIISLVFLMIAISTCVFFNTQSSGKKIADKPRSIIGTIDGTQKRKDSTQSWESVRNVKKATRNTKQLNRDVFLRKRRRAIVRNDQQREIGSEGRYSKIDTSMPNKQNPRNDADRYLQNNTTNNKTNTSFYNHRSEINKASANVQSNKKVKHKRTSRNDQQTVIDKVTRNLHSGKSFINPLNTTDRNRLIKDNRKKHTIQIHGVERVNKRVVEGRGTKAIITVNNREKAGARRREIDKVNRKVRSNTPATIEGTSRGCQRRNKNKMGRYSISDMAPTNNKRSETDQQREKFKEGWYIQSNMEVYNEERLDDGRQRDVDEVRRNIYNEMTVSNKYISRRYLAESRMAMNKVSPNIFPFDGDNNYKYIPQYHHTVQKRNAAGRNRIEQQRSNERNVIKEEGVGKRPEIKQESCSFGESDIERNCKSLFQCCHNENKTNPNCYCDEFCPLFDDCCHDTNTTSVVVPETYRALMPRIHCTFVKRADSHYRCQVVESCPKTFANNDISKKCENNVSDFDTNPLLSIPVTDTLQVTYKNVFCALCSGIRDVRFWKMKYSKDYLKFKNVINFNDYSWKNFPFAISYITVFPPDDLSVRFCHGLAVKYTQGDLGNESISSQCKTLHQFLYSSLRVWDNGCLTAAWEFEYCYPNHVTYTNCSTCEPLDFSSGVTKWTVHSTHVLFTFNIGETNCDNSHKLAVTKGEDSLYICPTSTLLNPSYNLNHYMRIEGNLSSNTFDFLGTTLFSYASALTDSEIYLDFIRRFIYQPTECEIQLIRMKLIYLTQTDQSHWNRLTKLYDDLIWTYTEIHDRGRVVVSRLPSTSIQNYTLCDFSTYRTQISTMFIKENSAIFQYLPTTHRFCRNVKFSLVLKNPDASISDQLNELRVSESDCAMDVKKSQYTFDDVLTVISSTLMGTGCITLVCSLVSTFVLKTDVSIPGLITRHMMITTLLFQFLFIVGSGATDNYVVCFAFGVALHYSTLCVFAWMSLCVGYLAKTLIKINKLPGSMHDKGRKSRYFLICLGYILPTFVVIPSVIIDTCQCFSFSIDYGHGICFPSPTSYPEGLLVFIGPISVHILFNIVCLTVSIQEVSRAKVSVALLSISRSYTSIYLKLCVYSGIGWVFGIATLVLPFNVIKLLFTVSCSSQGLFLSVITLCNIRVLRQLRSQLSTSNKTTDNK